MNSATASPPVYSIEPQAVRRIILEQSKRANVGHIGCNLSVADIIATLYEHVLQIRSPEDPARDRFVLSKGHAALSLYAALHLKGWLPIDVLNRFCANASPLGVHPHHHVRGIEYSTGSLGLGLSYAAGAALAARLKKQSHRVFALLSDGECNEGSVWEAVMFAAQQKLSNLTAIVDVNGQQAFGYARDVIDLAPMAQRWTAFGWKAVEVDGHNLEELAQVLSAERDPQRPLAVLARTVFGKGVSYMEKKLKWHYFPMSDAEYQQALDEIQHA